ncbi:MAG TPA: hypothetical protein DGN59_20015, partial [Candidatus Latescibacteria bacterium]|nr:hypothetical protein [Candidatus Latescibacterota bacterium]
MEQGYEELLSRLDDLFERGLLTEVEHSALREQALREGATDIEPSEKSPQVGDEPTGKDDRGGQGSEESGPDLIARKAAELNTAEAELERKRVELQEAEQAEQERLRAEAAADLRAQEAEREELERLRAERDAVEVERLEKEREGAEAERARLLEEADTERARLETERKEFEHLRGPEEQQKEPGQSPVVSPTRNQLGVLAAVGVGVIAIVILLLVTRDGAKEPTANSVEPAISLTPTAPATTQILTTTAPTTT